jgi:2'-5' RNA ligase
MSLKRIFTGTFIDSSVFSDSFNNLQNDFRNVTKGKWVEPENLHFTYQFIGDTEESVVNEIMEHLKSYLIEYRSELIIKGLGAFPDLRNPRILFANVINPNRDVYDIQLKTTRVLEKFGYQAEKRQYHPHITLQRIKFADRTNFRTTIEKYSETLFGNMLSFKFCLIESILTPNGAIYKIIK